MSYKGLKTFVDPFAISHCIQVLESNINYNIVLVNAVILARIVVRVCSTIINEEAIVKAYPL